MNRTKDALVALLAMTYDNDHGPAWLRLIVAIAQLAAALYLAWYIYAGPDPVERGRK